MQAMSRSPKYFLAILALGMVLAGCNRNAETGKSPAPEPAAPAPATPAPDTGTAPPASGSAAPTAPGEMAKSAGEAVDDTVITGKVKAAFLADPEVKGSDISVETKMGDVTLSGTVASQAQSDAAARIARGVEGVKNVDNKLSVKG